MTARGAVAAVVAAAVAVAALAGCGGDDGDVAPSTSRQVTTTAPPPTTLAPTTTTTPTPHPPPELPDDPAALAAVIVDGEQAALDESRPDGVVGPAVRRAQAAVRELSVDPALERAVLGHVPAELRAAVAANAMAGRELRALTEPRPSLPSWRIVAPAPVAELRSHYLDAQGATGVQWSVLAAIHLVETRFGRIRGTSTAGARGPMQFIPSTWAAYGDGGDIESNRDAIHAAARYLRANGAPERLDDALFRYNRSRRYVRAVRTYADRMAADARALRAYWHWDVYYRLATGDVVLPIGWAGPAG